MTKPRSHYVDTLQPRFYHLGSRCVRRAWLLGKDPLTKRNYDHRKLVFLNRLKHLSKFFSVEIMGYAIMSNHFHLVVHFDPLEAQTWDDEEVARRWCAAFNGLPFSNSHLGAETLDDFSVEQRLMYHDLLTDTHRLQRCRVALGSLSRFMQHLKQPFALWANREEACTGHLFESRFYSGVLLDQNDLLSCMAYVDLNPVEAKMVETLKASANTSIHERLLESRFDPKALDAYLAPMWGEGKIISDLKVSIRHYAEQLNLMIVYRQHPSRELLDRMDNWLIRLVNREKTGRKTPHAFFDNV